MTSAELSTTEGLGQHHVEREWNVHKAHDDHDGISKHLYSLNVPSRNTQHRRHFLPAPAGMDHEDTNWENVEERPQWVLEDLEF